MQRLLHRPQPSRKVCPGFVHSGVLAEAGPRGPTAADLLLCGEPTQEIKIVLLLEASVDRSHGRTELK